jgi:hypothetical protein
MDNAFLAVGFSVQGEPTVNQRQVDHGYPCNRWLTLLLDQSLILIVRTDPYPNKIRAVLDSDGAVIDSNSRGPQITDSLEMQGGVGRVLF